MPKINKVSENNQARRIRPAISPEARENQLIAMAYDLAEERLADKTASNDLVKEFIKLGNAKARLEKQKLEYETELVKAKTDAIESSRKQEELYTKAIKAMSEYSGHPEMADDVELMEE